MQNIHRQLSGTRLPQGKCLNPSGQQRVGSTGGVAPHGPFKFISFSNIFCVLGLWYIVLDFMTTKPMARQFHKSSSEHSDFFTLHQHPSEANPSWCTGRTRNVNNPPTPVYKHIHHPPKSIIFVCKQQRTSISPPPPCQNTFIIHRRTSSSTFIIHRRTSSLFANSNERHYPPHLTPPHPPFQTHSSSTGEHIHHPPKNIIFVCKQQRTSTAPPTPPPPD